MTALKYFTTPYLGQFHQSHLTPPPAMVPAATYKSIVTPAGASTYTRRVQCENVGGEYSEFCQQPPRMGPMPGAAPGFPQGMRVQACVSYCNFDDGGQAVWDDRFNNWRPPLRSLLGLGDAGGGMSTAGWLLLLGIGGVLIYKAF